ncbi:MAG: hypothetical protein QGI43_03220 [Gemmatimonadota bacterium]|nr:hypothetical protein [Gemmatimonadota bacterium]
MTANIRVGSRMTAVALLGFLAVGCSSGEDGRHPAAKPGDRARRAGGSAVREMPAVQLVEKTYYPRPERDEFIEVIDLDRVGRTFVLLLRLRLESPREGPWTARFVNAEAGVEHVVPGLRVDVATGGLTFLCRTGRFPPGDWNLSLEAQEGAEVSGPTRQGFRFRVD